MNQLKQLIGHCILMMSIHKKKLLDFNRAPKGAKYFALFTDDYSGWRVVFFLQQKSEAAECFKAYMKQLRTDTGNLIHTLRADNGGEFINNSFQQWLLDKGIRLETSAPHTPEQNGVSERANRTIVEGARSLLHAKRLPLELWAEAVSCTVYTLNRVSSKVSPTTPYRVWYGSKPDVSHLRIFGSTAFIHIPKAERRKLDSKSIKCYFVGYSLTQKAYRFWDPSTRKIKISRDVIFDERPTPAAHIKSAEPYPESVEYHPPVQASLDISHIPNQQIDAENNSSLREDVVEIEDIHTEPPVSTQPSVEPVGEANQSPKTPATVRHSPYPLRERTSKREWPVHLSTENSQQTDHLTEPNNYLSAITSADGDFWKEAINDEYQSLQQNNTWSLTTLPAGRSAIKSRWVFKIKPGVRDSPPRYKARLVAKGFSQRYGLDYDETYAPVAKHDTIRVVLSLVAAYDLEMVQLDIKTAFLYGELNEEIYLE